MKGTNLERSFQRNESSEEEEDKLEVPGNKLKTNIYNERPINQTHSQAIQKSIK